MTNEQAVHEMLQRFARAVTSGDGAGAATCWEVPALVVGDEGSRAVSSLAEVEAFFGAAQAQYHAQGVVGTRVEVERLDWHTQQLATVTVRWPYLDGDGRELGRGESSLYVVRVTDGQARICAVLLRGAG